jgi:hypothetical protein
MAEEKETVPNINWGSTQPIAPAGGPNSISASIQDRQAVADAFAGVARALIPEMERLGLRAGDVIQIRMIARWTGKALAISHLLFDQSVENLP